MGVPDAAELAEEYAAGYFRFRLVGESVPLK
jgi:hypothetical protein